MLLRQVGEELFDGGYIGGDEGALLPIGIVEVAFDTGVHVLEQLEEQLED